VRLFLAAPDGGGLREILVEKEETWLDLHPVEWVGQGQAFLWVSERDGWRHVYRIGRNGGNTLLLTPGSFDILSVEAVDEAGGWVYVIASPDDPGQRYLYRARLDGAGALERVTPEDSEGTNAYSIAPGARWAWHTVSTIDAPPSTGLVSLPDHRTVRVEVDNAALTSKLASLDVRPTEFFRVDIGDGVELDGWVMKPPDFDPNGRYPVLFYVYGMPAGQTVLDRWGGDRHLFHYLLTQRGYVVVSVDNRGTPAPRGRDFRRIIYLRHGVLPAQDQAAAVRALAARWPWMDRSRIGIYGWSVGGNVSMNAILRHPDVYSTAMPGAGLSHHKYYHASFTERFLGLPQDNPDAYEATAPVNVAQNLRGNLLVVHGTGDPNVHYQNAEALSNALIAAKKRFTIMPYPNRPHGIPDRYHLYDLYLWFLEENMPAGEGEPDGL
jgi:dipeptidyl-peptidase-4